MCGASNISVQSLMARLYKYANNLVGYYVYARE